MIKRRANPLFFQGPSATVRLCLFAVVSVILMLVDHRYQHLSSVRSVISIGLRIR